MYNCNFSILRQIMKVSNPNVCSGLSFRLKFYLRAQLCTYRTLYVSLDIIRMQRLQQENKKTLKETA